MSGKPSDDVHEALRNCVVHIRQTNDAIVEADRQRTDAITEGDLDVVRRVNQRIADLKGDLAALEEGRCMLGRKVAQLASTERLAVADAAIEAIRPALEELISLAEVFEVKFVEAAAAKAAIDKAFVTYRETWPKGLPRLPGYADFSLSGFTARLQQALTDCAREGLEKADYLLDDTSTGPRKRPSVLLRERAAAFVNELREKVREAEEAKAHVAAE